MRQNTFSEAQITGILKGNAAGSRRRGSAGSAASAARHFYYKVLQGRPRIGGMMGGQGAGSDASLLQPFPDSVFVKF
jgi:hypothetical protein